MGSRLVPHHATGDTLTVWVGVAGDESTGLELQVGTHRRPVPDAWQEWRSRGVRRLLAQRLTVDGLAPGRRYPIRLFHGGATLATAEAMTLPDRLPTGAEPPLVLLLGSCYAHLRDPGGAVGAAVGALPADARPAVTLLTGDQVYLDAPFPRYLWPRSAPDREADLLGTYLSTWGFLPGRDGLAPLLATGVTAFSSDDHELWNNAPTPGVAVIDTWTAGGRDHWLQTATALYRSFQAEAGSTTFRVGLLSVHVADTRLDRSADRKRFMSVAALGDLERWVGALGGPGILVVGQPIFQGSAGWQGRFLDYGLPDFEQYGELVRILASSRHDLLVLTGDVHFSRVAGCRLPTGATLIELISSPLALVDDRVGGKWREPPGVFPAVPVSGVGRSIVWFEESTRDFARPHVTTLGLAARGTGVDVTADAWPIPAPGDAPVARRILARTLH